MTVSKSAGFENVYVEDGTEMTATYRSLRFDNEGNAYVLLSHMKRSVRDTGRKHANGHRIFAVIN